MSNHLTTVNNLLNGMELREGEPIIIGVSRALGEEVKAYYIGSEFITVALFCPDEEPNRRWQWVINNNQSCWEKARSLKGPITEILRNFLNI